MSIDAIIVAAGRGLRAGSALPKQYRRVAGTALLHHAVCAFMQHPAIRQVRVVIAAGDAAAYRAAIGDLDLPEPVIGGATRQDSVRLGLAALAASPPESVLIHDAARPFVPAAVIDRVCAALAEGPAAIAGLPVTDTLKRADGDLAATGPARDGLWRAQTPQGFHFAAILAAHEAARAAGIQATDDAAIAEWAGLTVRLVPGAEESFKVTDAADLARAETMAGPAQPNWESRTGQGFDVHRFAPADAGRPLMLCGLALPGARGLAGHSDADVALHALCDAIYGALAEGDIGAHFPPSDPRFRGADSTLFVHHACDRIALRGGRLRHADITLVCEAPRIGPHRAAMRNRLADLLGLPEARISVKATTTERLGFLGRGEGIAALALATIALPVEDD